jgi:multidrug efflux pump subunit AcrB
VIQSSDPASGEGRLTTAQYFVYKRPVGWTLLVATALWGIYAYRSMPQRQDPLLQVRSGVVVTAYPGANAVEVEQELTRKVEKKLAENPNVEHVRSVSRQGLSVVFVDLFESVKETEPVWHDLDNKLSAMSDLPTAAGEPLRPRLDKDFGDTVSLMLTLSSPPIADSEVECRAQVIARRLAEVRALRPPDKRARRMSSVLVHPASFDAGLVERLGRSALSALAERGLADDGQYVKMLGAAAIDFHLLPDVTPDRLRRDFQHWQEETMGASLTSYPDVWPPVEVESLDDLAGALKERCQAEPGGVAAYTYKQLHEFADLIQDRLRQSPRVGKIEQFGVVDEAIYLYMSGRRLGASGFDVDALCRQIAERNVDTPGGTFELPDEQLTVKPSGRLRGPADLADVVVDVRNGYPVYLGDLMEVVRGYEEPPRILNLRTVKAGERLWTTRAVTLAVRQVKGTQIADFSREVDAALASLKNVLPGDLRIERTSDEPERVAHKIGEFRRCLFEAIGIVVIIALVFMEWRSALVVALSIPITLAMTLGICSVLGVDLQQVSIAALIIALGLLVDDPVVACDAINREMARGERRDVAAWLGPQKLARAILYATVTNCVAFLPLLLISGLLGEYIYSLPVVITASLVSSRIVSMTFIPLLGYCLLRGQPGMEANLSAGAKRNRFARFYNGFSECCMRHKWTSLAGCLIVLATACSLVPLIGTSFFPKDLHTVFTVDLSLPEGTPIGETRVETMRAIGEIDRLLADEAHAYTSFIGAGGPRFWLSIVPEHPASNYAQILIHTRHWSDTSELADRLKRDLPPRMATARVRVTQLEAGPPIGLPVQVRISGSDIATLRKLGEQVKSLIRGFRGATDIQDDWGPESIQLGLRVSPERANVSGVTNESVARLVNGALAGITATKIRQKDRLIPVVLKLRPDERSQLNDVRALSLPTAGGSSHVPLDAVADFRVEAVAPKIGRRDHERCLTVKCDTLRGVLPSALVKHLETTLPDVAQGWPAGYKYAFGGEKEEQEKGFASTCIAMLVSLAAIYLALVVQFNSLTKPIVVFAAVPFGMVGGLMGLLFFNLPIGFLALLGLASLAGVIISHMIVLFEYIEEARDRGEPLRNAVIDAALIRLRPVLVTVLATVGGLIPLAMRGGPLWEPLCYVQIVGLLVAMLVTKIVVPVLYVIFVEHLKIIRWSAAS